MLTLAQAIIVHVLLILLVVASFRLPYLGVVGYYWLAFNFPISSIPIAPGIPWLQIIVASMLIGLVTAKKEITYTLPRPMGFLIVFWFWTCITTMFAINITRALTLLFDFTQILVVSMIAVFQINSQEKIKTLVLAFILALIPHSTEVGIVGILAQSAKTGYGLRDSFFNSENQMARIVIIIIPFLYFCFIHFKNQWMRWGALGALALNVLSLITTGSRGGFVAFAAMCIVYWLISRKKLRLVVLGTVGILALFAALPEARRDAWLNRMDTIESRDEDGSYNERLRAWAWAVDLANSKPLVGGGFGAFSTFVDVRSNGTIAQREAHSNYFELIGTQGYAGLGLYLLLGGVTLITAFQTARKARWHPEMFWARDLMYATQVALVGYFVGGLTITHAFWQPYYFLIVLVAATKRWVDKSQLGSAPESSKAVSTPGQKSLAPAPTFAARR